MAVKRPAPGPGKELRRVGDAWRSSMESRAILVLGDVERRAAGAAEAEAEATEGEGVRSWGLEDGDGCVVVFVVEVVGEGGRGTVSGGCCGLLEKKPKTFMVSVIWLRCAGEMC